MCYCFRGHSLNFTNNLNVNFISYTFPPLHRLISFLPADHEIVHQWIGKPTFKGFQISTPKKATKVASETTD